MEELGLPAVRPAGLVVQPDFDTAILAERISRRVVEQYRRLLIPTPAGVVRRRRNQRNAPSTQLRGGSVELDLQILVENVAMGLSDLAERLEYATEVHDLLLDEAEVIRTAGRRLTP